MGARALDASRLLTEQIFCPILATTSSTNTYPRFYMMDDTLQIYSHESATPKERLAASRVLDSNIAMVIGPTPPGTGVMSDAT